MHLESHGIETGDRDRPFVARITMGSRNRQKILHEWSAGTLKQAQQQADDWLAEYSARLGIGSSGYREPAEMCARWARFETIKWLPDLPDPVPEYFRAIEKISGASDERDASPQRARSRYPTRSKIRSVVAAARAAGIEVAGIRVWPDGSIAAFDGRLSVRSEHASVVDKFEGSAGAASRSEEWLDDDI